MSHSSTPSTADLISVIIPCYNQGRFLATAIDSVLTQSYQPVEIIVVDDGSTDDTKDVAQQYPAVKYLYQSNKGPSAARNSGIESSLGHYLLFLDADDWLLPDALSINLNYLLQNSDAAFVSGAHKLWYVPQDAIWEIKKEVSTDHYCHLLEGNFIGMPGTVMYRRWVFDYFQFDVSLRACEDYELYLKIARSYPVLHHTQLVAVYRIHDANATNNFRLLLEGAIRVLENEKKYLRSYNERKCWIRGMIFWKNYYSEKIYDHLIVALYDTTKTTDRRDVQALKCHHQLFYDEYRNEKRLVDKANFRNSIKSYIRKFIPR